MTKTKTLKPWPLLYMLERILCGSYTSFADSSDWKELRYAARVSWLAPLLEIGAIRETSVEPAWPEGADSGGRLQFNYHRYAVTAEGVVWWAAERTKQVEGSRAVNLEVLTTPGADGLSSVDGKGIGSLLQFHWEPDIDAAVKGIRDGYFKFESYYWGHPAFWRMNDGVTVSLTEADFQHFGSLPKLLLECA